MSSNVLPVRWVHAWCVAGVSGCKHPTAVCKMETAQKRDADCWPETSFHLPGELDVGELGLPW